MKGNYNVERLLFLTVTDCNGSFADLEQGSMPCMEYFALHRIGRVKAQEI